MSFNQWVSRQLRTGKTRQHPGKRRSRKTSPLRVEQLESRRLLALVTLGLPNGGVLITPDPNMQFADMTMGPDPDYYSVTLTFSHSNQVQYSWTRLTAIAE